jgi:hypothetical protein
VVREREAELAREGAVNFAKIPLNEGKQHLVLENYVPYNILIAGDLKDQ